MIADLQTTVVLANRLVLIQFVRRSGFEVAFDLLMQGRLVILDGQEVVATRIQDGLRDGRAAPHGVDRNQGAFQVQALEQRRYGHDLVGLFVHGVLPEDEPSVGGESRNQVQGRLPGLAVMTAPRRLAVDRDLVGALRPAGRHPALEARRKQAGIHAVHQRPQPVHARDAVMKLRKTTQKRKVGFTPIDDVLVVVPVRDGAAHHKEQDLSKRVGQRGLAQREVHRSPFRKRCAVDRDRSARPVPGPVAERQVVFQRDEIRQHVLRRPAGRAIGGPFVEGFRHSPDREQAVDRGAASDPLAAPIEAGLLTVRPARHQVVEHEAPLEGRPARPKHCIGDASDRLRGPQTRGRQTAFPLVLATAPSPNGAARGCRARHLARAEAGDADGVGCRTSGSGVA